MISLPTIMALRPWRRRTAWLWVLAAILVLVIAIVVDKCVASPSQKPDAVVDRLTHLPHGTSFVGPEERRLLDKIRKNPEPYLPALERRVTVDRKNLRSFVDPPRAEAFLGALNLLFFIGDSSARRIVHGVQDSLSPALGADWPLINRAERGSRRIAIAPTTQFMIKAQRAILAGWEHLGTKEGVPVAVVLISQADYATAMSALQYLVRVASGDSAVALAATRALRGPTSSLGRDPTAAALLQALYNDTPRR